MDLVYSVMKAALLIGLPAAGVIAAGLLMAQPSSSLTRWWALGYSLVALAVTAVLAARFWWPGDDQWNGLHLLAVALAVEAFALSWMVLRMAPSARRYGVVRALAAAVCLLSAVAVFLTVGAGSGL